MKRLFSFLLILCLIASLLIACDSDTTDGGNTPGSSDSDRVAPKHAELDFSEVVNMEAVTTTDAQTDYVLLDIANYGKILIRLFPNVAPSTVENFKSLVAEGFYDGLIFHRVINNFMIQGGDPAGNGTGGHTDASGKEINIKGEFNANGFENNLRHLRGVVSMARTSANMNSASSQFFICHQNYMSGNGQYAAFGYVVYGMGTVDKIAKVSTDSNDKPMTDVVITSAKFANVPAEAFIKPAGTHSAPTMKDIDFTEVSDLSLVTPSQTATDYVLLDVAEYGKILIRLYPNVAPETVANFKKLVADGFYDGLIFHRVMENFMIQGGDPEGTGYGGSDEAIKGEFAANGFENNLSHVAGVISMARLLNDMDSATSQFFICHKDFTDGNGQYAAFGYVVYGMDVVDAIAKVETDLGNKPITDVVITSAKFANVPTAALKTEAAQ